MFIYHSHLKTNNLVFILSHLIQNVLVENCILDYNCWDQINFYNECLFYNIDLLWTNLILCHTVTDVDK